MCTVALGMGLNALHVRHIIYYKPPTTIERYFQETGKAERGEEPSYATLYTTTETSDQTDQGLTKQ